MKTYRDLIVWQKAMILVSRVYELTRDFPSEEKFGLQIQIRRCAVSIPSNIAEGYGRNSGNEFSRFLQISMGSLFELQTQIEISYNLKFIKKESLSETYELTREIERMLSSLINKIKESNK